MGDASRDPQRLAGQQMSHGEGGYQARSHALAARGGVGGVGGGGWGGGGGGEGGDDDDISVAVDMRTLLDR